MQHNENVIYSVYDNKATAFVGPLLTYRADAVAIRTFGDIISDPNTELGRHPADYDLVALGHIDESGIKASSDTYPRKLINGQNLLETLKQATDAR